jgi:hypothetical protein
VAAQARQSLRMAENCEKILKPSGEIFGGT